MTSQGQSWLGLAELLLVLVPAAGWCLYEIVTLRRDRQRREAAERSTGAAGGEPVP